MLEDLFRQSTDADLSKACGVDPGLFCRLAFEWTGNETFAAIIDAVAGRGGRVLLIVIGAFILRRLIRRQAPRITTAFIDRRDASAIDEEEGVEFDLTDDKRIERELRRERARQRASTLGVVIASIMGGIVAAAAILMILDQFGVNLAPLIAGAGVAGVAIGFGAQQMVKDFLAGVFIILEDEYGVGDVVDTGHATGVVERVSLRVTQLRDVNGTVWYVPNGEIQRVGNRSHLWARAVLDIDVAYDTDIDKVEPILLRVANEVWQEQMPERTIIAPPEFWGVEAFGADGVTLRLVVRTEPTEQWAVARELRGRIKKAFDEAGIEIPFPQRTVWINGSGADASSGEASIN
jgi:small conductance mechanosensitive channel